MRCKKLFAAAGCVFWAGFIKVHAVFRAVFTKDFSIKQYSFVHFAEVVSLVST